jgi:DNA mismatch repair protein MutS2
VQIETLKKLEFDKIQERLANLTQFEGGRSRAFKMKPSQDIKIIKQRLDETQEAMEFLRFGEPGYFNELKLIDQALAKARIRGTLTTSDLYDIYLALRAARLAGKSMQSAKTPALSQLCSGLTVITELENEIDRCIGEDGQVRDSASAQLRGIRSQITTLRLRIKEYLQDFIRSGNNQKLLQDSIVTERDGRYVVPVKQEHRHQVRGIVHDESASGATVFIEPMAVVDNNNRIRTLQAEEKREVERILQELSAAVAEYTEELAANQDILSILDFILARGRLAYRMNAYRPDVNQSGLMDISRGQHPLLGEEAIPINLQLGQRFDILVITGPNTGGKTVTLKMVGLLAVMAMSGLFIPARENSRIPIYKEIYVDIGDEQSIEQSLSTFSGHMKNIIQIIKRADRHSLVLLDELGAGTDPVEGAALARVVLEELLHRQAQVIVTTHQSELKSFAYQNERVENACVEFDPKTLKPTYELTIGMPGQSNAFQIASRLGLDQNLVDKAKKLVPEREAEVGNMIRELKAGRQAALSEAEQVAAIRRQLEEKQQQMEQERYKLEETHREILAKARQEAARYLRQAKQESDLAVQELKELLKDKQNPPRWHEVEAKRKRLTQLPAELSLPEPERETFSGHISSGDYVLISSINQRGTVLSGPDAEGSVQVQVGAMKLTVKQSELVKSKNLEHKPQKERVRTYLEKARSISKELDLRGKMADEALILLDRYLDDARLAGLESVRIIHGKGTGALRAAVREYLKGSNYVSSFRDGLREEGGLGVTVVEL